MSQNYCRYCGFLINGAKFCTSCGKKQPTNIESADILENTVKKVQSNNTKSQLTSPGSQNIYCYNCGTLMNGNTFCPSCGEKRIDSGVSSSDYPHPADKVPSSSQIETPFTKIYDETEPTKEFLVVSYTLTVLFPIFGLLIYLYVRVTNPQKAKKIINVTLYFAFFYILGLLAYGFLTFIIVLILFYPILLYSIYHPEKLYFGFKAR